MPRYAVFLILLCLGLSRPATAWAWSLGATASGGVMQQPTSHYYHAVYGGEAGFATESEGFLMRASYIERPEFHASGYSDKDYGWFGMLGTKVTKKPGHGLYAYLGAGRMSGYTKADAAFRGDSGEAKNHYIITGPTAAIAYGAHLGPLWLAAEHQVFVGFVDKFQTQAMVAWPYTFFQLKIGVVW